MYFKVYLVFFLITTFCNSNIKFRLAMFCNPFSEPFASFRYIIPLSCPIYYCVNKLLGAIKTSALDELVVYQKIAY